MGRLLVFSQVVLVVVALLVPALSQAQFFLVSEGNSFVDPAAREKTIGIEIEFKGLSDTEIVNLIKRHYPEAEVSGSISEKSGVLFATSIGQIKVVIEGQAYKYENDPVQFEKQKQLDLLTAPREIVFPPVRFDEIARMDALIKEAKDLGATGTSAKDAVSLQVNVGMRDLKTRQDVKYVLDLLRNYHNPKHRAQVEELFMAPKKRQPYIQDFSPGFMRVLNNPAYNPTPREFYDDFMYRQSLEFLGHADAWTRDLKSAKALLLSYPGESAVVPRVMKMNKIRISSLLLRAFPDDELSKRVVESRWARPAPVVEVREFNNDFELLPKVRWSLGAIRGAELFGAYDHDHLFSSLTGIAQKDIVRLRQGLLSGKRNIRYVLQSPEGAPLTIYDREWLRRYNEGIIQIQLSPDKVGAIPLILQNGTVVWHRRNIHRTTLLGEMNPGLENSLLQQALENKLVEALAFNKYAPNSFPETVSLLSIDGANTMDWKKMVKALNMRFPDGWVLKGAWDLSSEKIIITDKTDFESALRAYKTGYEVHKQKVQKQYGESDPELVVYHLKKHPGYLGAKILDMLSDKNLLLVQQRRSLVEEFRVEILSGRVLGQGSTIPRFAYLKKNKVKVHPVFIRQAENFAQAVVDKLPAELKALPYAFDVALTAQGDWILIETNPGGNSSFLEENPKSSRALVEYLNNYRPPTRGLLSLGEQMTWIRNHLTEFGLKASTMYPGIEMGLDSFEDRGAFQRIKSAPDLEKTAQEILNARLPRTRGVRCEAVFL